MNTIDTDKAAAAHATVYDTIAAEGRAMVLRKLADFKRRMSKRTFEFDDSMGATTLTIDGRLSSEIPRGQLFDEFQNLIDEYDEWARKYRVGIDRILDHEIPRALDAPDDAPEMSGRQVLEAAIAKHKLTIDAVFVPFSRSRNKAEKYPSLNWIITLKRDGKPILLTDYSAGCGHCPSATATLPKNWKLSPKAFKPMAERFECENGFASRVAVYGAQALESDARRPILPDAASVIWSICQDSDVIDYPTFEQWASEFGYDPDSRSGEAIYRACLEIALKLRAGIGEAALMELREAGQDF